MKKILIAAPLEYELHQIREIVSRRKFLLNIQFLVLGVGPKKSVKTLENFLAKDSAWDHIVIVGLAGALTDQFKTGDWVIPSSVSDGERKIEIPGEKPDFFYKSAHFFTSNKILKPSEKKELRGHEIVDMETYPLVAALEKAKAGYSVLRVVLDEKDYVFPDFKWIFSENSLKTKAGFFRYGLFNPKAAFKVIQYKKMLKKTLKELTKSTILCLGNIKK